MVICLLRVTSFMHVSVQLAPKTLRQLIPSTFPYKKEVGLTDLVLPFYGEFHQQLLGIGADEDEWGGRLLTGIRELQGWGGGKRRGDQFSIILLRSSTAILCTEWVSPHDAQYHCDESFSECLC